jgi:hypothetical protein
MAFSLVKGVGIRRRAITPGIFVSDWMGRRLSGVAETKTGKSFPDYPLSSANLPER